jgi:hydrogenase maturation protein HypF
MHDSELGANRGSGEREGPTRLSGAKYARRALRVRGTVQGVGFRPAVYRLARSAGLGGFVRNDSEGVWIEVEGEVGAVCRFSESVGRRAPRLARIVSIDVSEVPVRGEREFRIVESTPGSRTLAEVPADAATCDACLRELFDPLDRRHRYPFINCTDCGPRFTIVRGVPYDRARTTMAAFAMCTACRGEYEDPASRRFHAEPNACPACGPRVALLVGGAIAARDDAAVAGSLERLSRGGIVALKGLGGYQLAVDASDERAVVRLRERKGRPRKPFALMVRDLATAECLVDLEDAAREALLAPARPIVLLARKPEGRVASAVAPGLSDLGIMLASTPLHHLLLRDGPAVLVVTSGNRAEEPIAKDEDEAACALAGIADAQLVHDRPIHSRADDSVVRVVCAAPQAIRRARGFVPDCFELVAETPCVLAVGSHAKNTVCITRGGEAVVSQHIGDLDSPEGQAFFEETIGSLAALLGVVPAVVAHDLHPEYASTRWALDCGLPSIGVQHHHAHVASCLAEHGHRGRAIGVAFDGTGCGPQGDLWGGEILLVDGGDCGRLGHLRPIDLVGGEAAVRQPWRVGVAALRDAGVSVDAFSRVGPERLRRVLEMLDRGAAVVPATGAGRWFDAIASILGVCDAVTYEGQAAIELEAAAASQGEVRGYPFGLDSDPADPFVIDLRPTVRAVALDAARREPTSLVSARFHATLAHAVVESCRRARDAHGVCVVALSGGCFQNRRLTEGTRRLLAADGFDVLVHRRVPPNDGGVSLGQAAVAAHRLSEGARPHVPRDPR